MKKIIIGVVFYLCLIMPVNCEAVSTCISEDAPITSYLLSNYSTKEGQAINRFRSGGVKERFNTDMDECGKHDRYVLADGVYCVYLDENGMKVHIEKPADEKKNLKPYYDALQKAFGTDGKRARNEYNITGVYESAKYGIFIFFGITRINVKSGELTVTNFTGSEVYTTGFINIYAKSIVFKDEATLPMKGFSKQFWDIFEFDGYTCLLVNVLRDDIYWFDSYVLKPGKIEYAGNDAYWIYKYNKSGTAPKIEGK